MEESRYKEQSIITQVLTSNVKFVIGVVTIALGVVAPYYGIRQDIALIQSNVANINSNHEVHIQDMVQDIKDLQTTSNNQQLQIIELQKQLIAIQSRK